MTETRENRRKKLLYRASYRGFKEADILIGSFARAYLADMDDDGLDEFEVLLKLNDRDLYAWATGDAKPPANIQGPIFTLLLAFDLQNP